MTQLSASSFKVEYNVTTAGMTTILIRDRGVAGQHKAMARARELSESTGDIVRMIGSDDNGEHVGQVSFRSGCISEKIGCFADRYFIAVTGPDMPKMQFGVSEEIFGAGMSPESALANAVYFGGGDFSREDFVVKPCTKTLHDAAIAAAENAHALRYSESLADLVID